MSSLPATTSRDRSVAAPRRARWPALLLLLPIAELVAQLDVTASVPSRDDWRAAAAFARAEAHHDGECARALVITEPVWAAPIGRWALGRVAIDDVAPVDLAGRREALVLSIRGHSPSALAGTGPRETRRFGRVSVLRYALDEPRRSFDFVEALGQADTTWGSASLGWGACNLRSAPVLGGGLGAGTMLPRERFVCDGGRPWLGAGASFQQDAGLALRRCVAQSAPRGLVVRARFAHVPLVGVLEGRIGLAHGDERLRREPVRFSIRIDDVEALRLRHRDGDGARRFSIDLGGRSGLTPTLAEPTGPFGERGPGARTPFGDVTFETTLDHTSTAPGASAWRMPCWSASIRSRRGATPIETR